MKSSNRTVKVNKDIEHGRIIAQGMHKHKVEQQKNMIRADKRKETMLEKAAKVALSGGVLDGSRNKT